MVISGQETVAAAGTAVQINSDEAVRVCYIRAHPDNTGNIAIGNDGSGDVTMSNGLVLKNTDPPIVIEAQLSELWVDAATSGDKVVFLANARG